MICSVRDWCKEDERGFPLVVDAIGFSSGRRVSDWPDLIWALLVGGQWPLCSLWGLLRSN